MLSQLRKYLWGLCLIGVLYGGMNGCGPPGPSPEPTPKIDQRELMEERERSTAEWAYQQGLQRLDRGDYQAAIQYFQLAAERDPRHLRAYLSLGDVYSKLDNYMVAETYYNKVLKYDPQSVPALTALATMHWKMGNHREALSVYHKALEIDPENQFLQQQIDFVTRELFNNYYEQGMAYKKAREFGRAATELQKAYSLYPDNVDFAIEIGYLFLEQPDYMMADGYFQRVLSEDPNNVAAIIGAGKVQLGLKHYNVAANYFKQALSLRPGDQEADELLQRTQTKKVRATLPQEYWSIGTSEQVTRGDIAALLMVELMLESRLEFTSRVAIISDITTHWAKPYIIKAVRYGIMQLPPDRFFRPDEPIRKGELAFVLDTLFNKLFRPLPEGSSISFSDVHPDNDYHNAVLRVYSAGLMTASTEETFGVLETLSGEEVMQIFEKVKAMLR
jgi:tetratricopeptide (TPR) repeat protein